MPNDRVAVIGSEPQIYFHAARRTATGYTYMYRVMESESSAVEMQRRMIGEIEARQPRFVVLVKVAVSWNVPRMFDPAAEDYAPTSPVWVAVFERKA